MLAQIVEPTEDLVRAACVEFDKQNGLVEETLSDLFARNPLNQNVHEVLVKAAVLNALYSTQIYIYPTRIPGLIDVAEHIARNGKRIDAELTIGSAEVVDLIARVSVPEKAARNNYSFATKYCSWHSQARYPIWDQRSDNYLWSLQKRKSFMTKFTANADLWDYAKFRDIIDAFAVHYSLSHIGYKNIDKFLWKYGGD